MKKSIIFFALFVIVTLLLNISQAETNPSEKTILSSDMAEVYSSLAPDEDAAVWVFFLDRGLSSDESNFLFEELRRTLPERTILRRSKSAPIVLDETDLPVNPEYIQAVISSGAEIRIVTRYFNGVSVNATLEQVEIISALPFVKAIQPVARGKRHQPIIKRSARHEIMDYNYGESYTQLQQINVPAVHEMGFTGEGVLVCMLDTGFNLEHITFWEMDILAAWDFINGDSIVANQPGDPEDQHNHGTYTLSTCGGKLDYMLYGPAFESTFMLGKTEMVDQELPIEEDYYVAGVEWADSAGADVISTSLGYFDWYTFADMDGNTAVTTNGVDIAVSHGIVCCTAAGNERNSSWGHIIAPADADSVIAVGAVSASGNLAYFSSPGPTYDGRIKPEVCAMGLYVYCADPNDPYGFVNVSGTSLSTPLVGGATALVLQAHPNWEPMTVREAFMMTASNSSTPNNDYGWGIIDVLAAIEYSYPPVIGDYSPEENSINIESGGLIEFSVSASDADNDPISYIFMLDDSVMIENETGLFDCTFNEAGQYIVTAIAQDLIMFADSVIWTVNVEESAGISITLSPQNPPIVIPASGGSFNFDITIENTGDTSIVFDGWTEVILPNGSTFGPIILRTNLNISAGAVISREDLTQFVPLGAPEGIYSYTANTGQYPDEIWASDSFVFEKSGALGVGGEYDSWRLLGWEEEITDVEAPYSPLILSAYPNPFNASTVISFEMQEAGFINLVIYDIQGRKVQALVNGQLTPGQHQAVWNAEELASGVYFAKLTAGSTTNLQKLLLIK